ncbi:unnamed protein product [Closterium sp. NIES-53]
MCHLPHCIRLPPSRATSPIACPTTSLTCHLPHCPPNHIPHVPPPPYPTHLPHVPPPPCSTHLPCVSPPPLICLLPTIPSNLSLNSLSASLPKPLSDRPALSSHSPLASSLPSSLPCASTPPHQQHGLQLSVWLPAQVPIQSAVPVLSVRCFAYAHKHPACHPVLTFPPTPHSNISYNYFTGYLPKIGFLGELKSTDLSNNFFFGSANDGTDSIGLPLCPDPPTSSYTIAQNCLLNLANTCSAISGLTQCGYEKGMCVANLSGNGVLFYQCQCTAPFIRTADAKSCDLPPSPPPPPPFPPGPLPPSPPPSPPPKSPPPSPPSPPSPPPRPPPSPPNPPPNPPPPPSPPPPSPPSPPPFPPPAPSPPPPPTVLPLIDCYMSSLTDSCECFCPFFNQCYCQ